ncbi:Myosin light chain kinase, smooth muscle [Melipona quadrifasciata]|uniref:Myosin light chain kinase, smooth muscle n=1 Tax=Melipona quadrifasciata TaxID=166423 RepID=A0A0M9A629_9HYME|nr:Myosin light chain kinase, smooth muscle [Melipona quadrifasciata]
MEKWRFTEVEPSFPYRNVTVRRGVEFNDHYDIQSEIGRWQIALEHSRHELTGIGLTMQEERKKRFRDIRRYFDSTLLGTTAHDKSDHGRSWQISCLHEMEREQLTRSKFTNATAVLVPETFNEILTRGKFGTVYRCKEKVSGLMLAAKVVNTAKKEDRRAVEREVEIMRRLQHPRLIQLYDAIDTGKQIHVVLELIEGGELFERVIDDDFVLTERSCAVFLRQICEGVEFIHRQNILHLDLKPENILCLTKEGNRIKIIDFGLAREYDPKKKLQVLFGTPEFVAPEVVNFDQIGYGTDMWSIGVICYVLLSGLSPFMGDTDLETMANVTIAKYDFDHDAFADISEDAKDFIRCLLVKDKDKRMSAAECREHRWLAKKPASQQQRQVKEMAKPQSRSVQIPRVRTSNVDELDVTKDNLRLFVERWREHPDSPYLIDIPQQLNSTGDHEELVSLRGQSPSPCASICSTLSETTDSSPRESHGTFLTVPSFGYGLERRASESVATQKPRSDPASQIVLAEEIIKLSERLRSIAMGACETPNDEETTTSVIGERGSKRNEPDEKEKEKKRNEAREKRNGSVVENSECNEITEKLSSIMRHRKLNGTTFHSNRSFDKYETNTGNVFASLRKTGRQKREEDSLESSRSESLEKKVEDATRDETSDERIPRKDGEMDLTPPWRRPRVKQFGETSRDVPRISGLRNLHKSLNLDEPANTKDLLLHLLGEWEEVATRPSGVGRKSVSVDWCGEESVARKTMNSLAEYFQSKQQKSTAANRWRFSYSWSVEVKGEIFSRLRAMFNM